ncbi:MAG: peptidoglycan-binding protein [Candidatus Omnitrophica bacterium]|nr:peptidoglycan-binding protein [Candidatus Omnitrophota bacterium]MBU1923697.1 peptidoglycan-binding protein [Candidatus Omnitrophota bacterium]
MEKRVLLLGLILVFVVSLSGCSTTRRNKDLEIQGLRNQISALETERSAKVEEVDSEQILDKSSEMSLGSLDKAGELKDRPSARQIQAALKNAGYYQGVIDGKLGRQSRQAIRDFQKANNLSVDGKVGKKTWAALKEYLQKRVK